MSFTTTTIDYSAILRRAATHLAAGAADAVAELADAHGLDEDGAAMVLLVLVDDEQARAAIFESNPVPFPGDFPARVDHHFQLDRAAKRLRSEAAAIRAEARITAAAEAFWN